MAMHGFGKLSYAAIGAALAIASAVGSAAIETARFVGDVFVTPTAVPLAPLNQLAQLQLGLGSNGLPQELVGDHFERKEIIDVFVLPSAEVPAAQYQLWTRVTVSDLGQFVQGLSMGLPANVPAVFYLAARGKRGFVAPVGPISLPKAGAMQAPTLTAPTMASAPIKLTLIPTLVPALQPTATPKPLTKDPLGEVYAEYYNNRDMADAPVVTRNEGVPNLNWGMGGPAGVNADNFSASYYGRFFFAETENFEFVVVADDGARLWVDDALVINDWRIGPRRELKADVPLTRGEHRVRLEYFESTGNAQISLRWAVNYSRWEARYRNSTDWTGAVVLKRNDGDADGRLRMDFGAGSPGLNVNPDNFSVSWERRVFFDVGGEYEFTLELDDGAKIYIDGAEVFNKPSAVDTHKFKRTLARGYHAMQVLYVEYGGGAKLKLDWALIPAAAPSP